MFIEFPSTNTVLSYFPELVLPVLSSQFLKTVHLRYFTALFLGIDAAGTRKAWLISEKLSSWRAGIEITSPIHFDRFEF